MDRIETLRSLLETNPGDALAHYLLATELHKLGRYRECIDSLTRYLALAEDEGAAYRTLAQCYEALDQTADARRAYETGTRQALKHHHPGMAEELRERLEVLAADRAAS